MTKNFKFVIVLLCLFFAGCVSEETQEAASKAAATINATKYTVGKGTVVGTDSENYKSLNIEFSDFDSLPDGYDNDKLSSTAALIFFNNLKPEDYSDFEKIKVIINRQNTTVETLYDIKQLIDSDNYLSVVGNLINSIQKKSMADMQACIDTTVIDKKMQGEIFNVFGQIDSTYGQFNDYMFNGFKFTEAKEEKTPIFVTWCQLQHDSVTTDLTLVINTLTSKIVSFSINEE